MNEAQTREDLITPAIRAAGWTKENQCQILVEQSACEFAPGRVGKVRGKALRADYILTHRGRRLVVVEAKGEGVSSFMVGTTEYAVPLGGLIDVEAEIAKAEAELKHLEGFLNGVKKKHSNERFVNNAPAAVVELERKKQSDAESKIATLKETIASLQK